MEPLSIFRYSDHVEWLNAWYKAWSKQRRGRNRARIARECGLSKAHVTYLFKGQRVPSPATVDALSDLMGLTDTERDYYQIMVQLVGASFEEHSVLLARMYSNEGFKRMLRLQAEHMDYISKWQHVVIHELAQHVALPSDPAAIVDLIAPEISEAEVVDAIRTLRELGLLRDDDDQGLRARWPQLNTAAAFQAKGMFAYHTDFLRLAGDALRSVTHKARYFGGATIAVPVDEVGSFKNEAMRLVTRIANLAEEHRGGRVRLYQLGVQLFPLSDPIDAGESDS